MKMVMAILYKDDEEETTRELHANRFLLLSSLPRAACFDVKMLPF